MWSREKLERVAAERQNSRKSVSDLQAAALAYARWQEMTDEVGLDTQLAYAELNRQLDAIQPDRWEALRNLVGTVDDEILKGLMSYSLQRATDKLLADQVDVKANLAQDHDADTSTTSPLSPTKRKTRGR